MSNLKPYASGNGWALYNADNREALAEMDPDSIDAQVSDPPYGLSREPDAAEVLRHWLAGDDYAHSGGGFMGKGWDSFVPGPVTWRAVRRVLKPGAPLLAFAGTRTYGLTEMALRLAEFEIREMICWLHGQGFPKSLDVSKALDKARNGGRDDVLRVTAWMRERCAELGLTGGDLNAAAGTVGMASHWLTDKSQPLVPTLEQWEKLEPLLGPPPEWMEPMLLPARKPGEAWEQREVVGSMVVPEGHAFASDKYGRSAAAVEVDITAPATDLARDWSGYGTALKPAIEPCALARKPLDGTVAENVTRWGVGGINIDGCRIEGGARPHIVPNQCSGFADVGVSGGSRADGTTTQGRFPSNLLLSHAPGCRRVGERVVKGDGRGPEQVGGRRPGGFADVGAERGDGRPNAAVYGDETIPAYECEPGCPVAVLDQQSGERKSPATYTRSAAAEGEWLHRKEAGTVQAGFGDTGGASRFYATFETDAPPFFYTAKASKRERGPGNVHPTVKPLALMRYLVRLVSRPGALVLDPFAGSGTTGLACLHEGRRFVGIEMSEEYAEIAARRLEAVEKAIRSGAPIVVKAAEGAGGGGPSQVSLFGGRGAA